MSIVSKQTAKDAYGQDLKIGDAVASYWRKKKIVYGTITAFKKTKMLIVLTEDATKKYPKGAVFPAYPGNSFPANLSAPDNYLEVFKWKTKNPDKVGSRAGYKKSPKIFQIPDTIPDYDASFTDQQKLQAFSYIKSLGIECYEIYEEEVLEPYRKKLEEKLAQEKIAQAKSIKFKEAKRLALQKAMAEFEKNYVEEVVEEPAPPAPVKSDCDKITEIIDAKVWKQLAKEYFPEINIKSKKKLIAYLKKEYAC